jgi:flagellar hook assembly protein FlgD
VAYRLPRRQEVRISVHDVRGRLIRTVVQETRDLGDHVMHWDGRGADGAPAPAGMYFIQLQTAQASRVQRVVVVR